MSSILDKDEDDELHKIIYTMCKIGDIDTLKAIVNYNKNNFQDLEQLDGRVYEIINDYKT